ncbi:Hypothetical predicted protein [Olea europaea subsp. europaea]|uniref:DUF7610 domain-containing protein n=1 Tax=Olea europaea subsp. europaea TaxID=158383 RepID=A0A8S0UUY7_OLEEU|nr:Hypothetical predicted protein [Olea europaea subsp. europaea]
MSKRSDILQKKLQELESEFLQVIHLPPETPSRHLISEGIEQRFVFLKNLLSAEISSQPSKPHHLNHIAERLVGLEAAFRDWDESRNYFELNDYNFDTSSVCSECTRACNLIGEAEVVCESDSSTDGFPAELFETVIEEKAPEKMEKEGRFLVIGKYCGMLTFGMILGAVCMSSFMIFNIENLYPNSAKIEDHGSIFPFIYLVQAILNGPGPCGPGYYCPTNQSGPLTETPTNYRNPAGHEMTRKMVPHKRGHVSSYTAYAKMTRIRCSKSPSTSL